ncbi:MAG: transcriptional regulator/antitoxin, MazE [Candidatus Methylomirabilota bacterium]|nr:transcriptional regulator/antitoxin, MazE [Candidatus Methylomirabilis sp.]NJD69141.1 transcriptional regulator/antitoxin, MazE [candidate division NC10 bacterium]PWB43900.1 MAG: transcriptional regulator/antitoxin, MazE [candidate division NC10 bacterium]
MITRVQKWGNSQGIRLSKQLLSEVEIKIGDAVDVAVRNSTLVVTALRRVRGGHNLRELVRRIPKDYKAKELDWRYPVGREIW